MRLLYKLKGMGPLSLIHEVSLQGTSWGCGVLLPYTLKSRALYIGQNLIGDGVFCPLIECEVSLQGTSCIGETS